MFSLTDCSPNYLEGNVTRETLLVGIPGKIVNDSSRACFGRLRDYYPGSNFSARQFSDKIMAEIFRVTHAPIIKNLIKQSNSIRIPIEKALMKYETQKIIFLLR